MKTLKPLVPMPFCKTPGCARTRGPWQIEVYNAPQEEWNLYSAIRLRPSMHDMNIEEAMEIIKEHRKTRPEFRKTLRLYSIETGDILMADVL